MFDLQAVNSNEARRDSHRVKLANLLVGGSYGLIAVVALSIVLVSASIIWSVTDTSQDDTVILDKGIGLLNNLVAAVFPMIAAWVGAVIAFYFARDNFEAASKNASDLLHGARENQLDRIRASHVMIPQAKLTIATTPAENDQALRPVIFKRFQDKNLGRIIVVDQDGKGVGVLHDSTVLKFLTSAAESGNLDGVTFGAMLEDEDIKALLPKSVVFARPDVSLADVRAEMDRASREAKKTVRDVFVTHSGQKDEPIVGYLSDQDIAKYGAFG